MDKTKKISMYKLTFFLSILIFVFLANCKSQSNINNDSIKFIVLRQSSMPTGDTGYSPVKYIIKVSMTKKRRAEVKKITSPQWEALLENETTDWAANLLLYNLFSKDALYFVGMKDISIWKSTKKTRMFSFGKTILLKKIPCLARDYSCVMITTHWR